MAHEVIMPALGMAQSTGIIVTWCKKLGDQVQARDILLEIETDKATMEIEAGQDGIVASISGLVGVPIEVGTTIATIAKNTAEVAGLRKTVAPPAEQTPAEQKPDPATPAKLATESVGLESKPPSRELKNPNIATAPQTLPKIPNGRVLASPKARFAANQRGINLQLAVNQGFKEPLHWADLDKIAVSATNRVEIFTELHLAELLFLSDFLHAQNLEENSLGVIFAVLLANAYRQSAGLSKEDRIVIAIQSWDDSGGRLSLVNPDQSGFADLQKCDDSTADWTILDLTQTSMITMKPATNLNSRWLVVGQKKEAGKVCLNVNFTPAQLSVQKAFTLMENISAMANQPLRLLL